MIPHVMRRIWIWWIDAAVGSGILPSSLLATRRQVRGGGAFDVSYPVRWSVPNFEEVDREAEAKASKEQLRNGLTTHELEWQKMGLVPAEMYDRLERERREFEARGIVLDSVPSATTSSGQAQILPNRSALP